MAISNPFPSMFAYSTDIEKVLFRSPGN